MRVVRSQSQTETVDERGEKCIKGGGSQSIQRDIFTSGITTTALDFLRTPFPRLPKLSCFCSDVCPVSQKNFTCFSCESKRNYQRGSLWVTYYFWKISQKYNCNYCSSNIKSIENIIGKHWWSTWDPCTRNPWILWLLSNEENGLQ